MISFLMSMLFYQRSDKAFTVEEINQFELMFSEAHQNGGLVNFNSVFPKYRFIDYIIQQKNAVAHGSNNMGIESFETRRQTLYNGKLVDAIFASKDGIWPIFYAVFDRGKLVSNFRNGCIKTRSKKRYYFFSLTKQTLDRNPWTTGMIYFMLSETFELTSTSKIYFDEWVSKQEVKPMLRLCVCKEDFEYINKISTHKQTESLLTTWFFYKLRTSLLRYLRKNVARSY
ncbi:hypothetical protein ACFPVX_03755 [Cohnella faecalis]|uniref:Uncharacterized protein n=1 Tax=Cohnella faecalis TaxID=2315694 RepID=A0A398CRF7_9BACL|nr:hypothetical protein [Cohnella faecalis]RIE03368.1 hypothetical protein D3H35_11860 [Cohnella faecalis]